MNTIENTTKKELLSTILDALNDGRLEGKEVSEFHHEIFNTDYYIIGYKAAEDWLVANYGVFAAIGKIQEYEKDNFGEVNTDCSSSEKVVNMLVYILGEEILGEIDLISENWDKTADEKFLKKLKKYLTKEISE